MRLDFRDHVTGIPRFGLPQTAISPTAPFFPVQGKAQDVEITTGLTYYFTGAKSPSGKFCAQSELHHRAARQRAIAGDDGRSALEHMPGRVLLHVRIF